MAEKLTASEKKIKNINFLKKIGFLYRYNDLELYHGRCQVEGENWAIRGDVDNSHDANKNNIMGTPCLCVASYKIAESYANGASLGGRNGNREIHEIISSDEEALIINEKFDVKKLSEKDAVKFFQAVQSLTKGVMNKYCLKIEGASEVLNEIRNMFKDVMLISQQDLDKIYKSLVSKNANIEYNNIKNVVSAINSSLFFQKMPVMTASSYVFDLGEKRNYLTSGGLKYDLNQDYIRKLFDENNIIGVNKKSFSSDRDFIVYLFNFNKILVANNDSVNEKE